MLWLKNQLRDLGLEFPEVPILCDNMSTISLAKNPVQHTRTKHIDVRYNKFREFVANGCIQLVKVPTQDNVAHMMTKPLPGIKFKQCLDLANAHGA